MNYSSSLFYKVWPKSNTNGFFGRNWSSNDARTWCHFAFSLKKADVGYYRKLSGGKREWAVGWKGILFFQTACKMTSRRCIFAGLVSSKNMYTTTRMQAKVWAKVHAKVLLNLIVLGRCHRKMVTHWKLFKSIRTIIFISSIYRHSSIFWLLTKGKSLVI